MLMEYKLKHFKYILHIIVISYRLKNVCNNFNVYKNRNYILYTRILYVYNIISRLFFFDGAKYRMPINS